jgi:hypothetical protein
MTAVYALLANLVVGAHLAFVVFVVLGGLLVLRWPRVAWVHVPCAIWGGIVELMGWVCPLTPLEHEFRRRAGEGVYGTTFLEHYVIPLLYPGALTRGMQIGLGLGVVVLNVAVYALVWRRRRAARVS